MILEESIERGVREEWNGTPDDACAVGPTPRRGLLLGGGPQVASAREVKAVVLHTAKSICLGQEQSFYFSFFLLFFLFFFPRQLGRPNDGRVGSDGPL